MADLLRTLSLPFTSFIAKMAAPSLFTASFLPPIRRIVTGHDSTGRGTLKSDTFISPRAATGSGSEGLSGGGLWTTDTIPSKDTNDDSIDGALRPIGGQGLVMRNGTNLRFTDLAPGSSSPMVSDRHAFEKLISGFPMDLPLPTSKHRTSSIDYNILVSGKLILMLDDGSEILIENPGDTVVQRGNMHAWRNPGPGVARWVSVLVDAEPAVVNGKALEDAWLA